MPLENVKLVIYHFRGQYPKPNVDIEIVYHTKSKLKMVNVMIVHKITFQIILKQFAKYQMYVQILKDVRPTGTIFVPQINALVIW